MEKSREAAERSIAEETEEGEPSGLCPYCMLDLLSSGDYEIVPP